MLGDIFRYTTKVTESQHQKDSMHWAVTFVVHCSTAAERKRSLAYLRVKQNYLQ